MLQIELSFTPCKGIQGSLGFWNPRWGFRIPGTGFPYLSVELGFWIPIVSSIPDSLGCIPDSISKIFRDSGIRIPLHGAISLFLFLTLNVLKPMFSSFYVAREYYRFSQRGWAHFRCISNQFGKTKFCFACLSLDVCILCVNPAPRCPVLKIALQC